MTGIESEQHRAKIRERVVRVIGNYYKTPPPEDIKDGDIVYRHGTKMIVPSPADMLTWEFNRGIRINDKTTLTVGQVVDYYSQHSL